METSSGYAIRNQYAMHFLTFTVIDWVDIFSRKIYRDSVIESLKFCQKTKGLNIYAFVIMSNHMHIICQTDNLALSDVIRDFKKFVATNILNQIKCGPESRSDWMLKRFEFAAKSNKRNSNYQFWQVNSHPEEIFSEPFLWSKINYVHMNPVRAGIVSKASEYIYSSASNYVEKESILDIIVPSIPILNPLAKNGYDIDIGLW